MLLWDWPPPVDAVVKVWVWLPSVVVEIVWTWSPLTDVVVDVGLTVSISFPVLSRVPGVFCSVFWTVLLTTCACDPVWFVVPVCACNPLASVVPVCVCEGISDDVRRWASSPPISLRTLLVRLDPVPCPRTNLPRRSGVPFVPSQRFQPPGARAPDHMTIVPDGMRIFPDSLYFPDVFTSPVTSRGYTGELFTTPTLLRDDFTYNVPLSTLRSPMISYLWKYLKIIAWWCQRPPPQ